MENELGFRKTAQSFSLSLVFEWKMSEWAGENTENQEEWAGNEQGPLGEKGM